MIDMRIDGNFYDEDYYERGHESGKSLYENYHWMPELTIPMCHHIARYCDFDYETKVLDFGCAKGYVTKAFRMLGYNAFGVDISEYACPTKEDRNHFECIRPLQSDLRQNLRRYRKEHEGEDRWYAHWNTEKYDWIIAKDVLEHIPYDDIERQLDIFRRNATGVFAVIPLGVDGKYIVPEYEHDQSHFIRENEAWWWEQFRAAGFENVQYQYAEQTRFKENYHHYKKGNVVILANVVEK
jgi:2-polyprenyl-3-methyl-5-hydroxy-6-metoxy-1,4-benzoquinol methylase